MRYDPGGNLKRRAGKGEAMCGVCYWLFYPARPQDCGEMVTFAGPKGAPPRCLRANGPCLPDDFAGGCALFNPPEVKP